MKQLKNVELDSDALFRLRIMDAYQRMEKKQVRYLCTVFGIGKSTFYKWKKRYSPYNLSTLKSQSQKPKHLRTIPWTVVIEICNWKRENPAKSHYYLYQTWRKEGRIPPCSAKTIYNWWKKRGLIVKRHKRKRRKMKLFNRAHIPGELIQIDTKFLEGRRRFQYTAIDVVSKWRYVRAYNRLNQQNTIEFLKRLLQKAKEKGICIQRVQTDNGLEFQSEVFTFLAQWDIVHQYTWVHTPDQNGVVERSHRTDEEEFYQCTETRDMTLGELNQALDIWIEYYNTKRLHFSLNFDTPDEYLRKVSTI